MGAGDDRKDVDVEERTPRTLSWDLHSPPPILHEFLLLHMT